MNIETTDLTEKTLTGAPEWPSHPFSCKYCLYWELPEECVDPATEQKKDLIEKKLGWLRRVNSEWGNCGKVFYLDGQPIGYAQYAPPRYLPRSADYDSGPPGDDAVLISCLFIPQRQFRRLGIGSQLLTGIIGELRKRRERAIETFARKGSTDNPSGPIELYLTGGFRIHRDDKEFPLMRLDLRIEDRLTEHRGPSIEMCSLRALLQCQNDGRNDMKRIIEVHDMETNDEYFVGTCTHINESEEIDSCGSRRLAWLRARHEKGARVKVAMVDSGPVGFLYAIPIEFCPWGPLGRDLLVIPCLVSVNKGHGVAKALLDAAQEEARRQGRKGIVTIGYYHDFWFMPASFFEANGFLKCGGAEQGYFDPKSRATVLWRPFDERAEAPVLLKPKYEFKPVPGRVGIDLFWNEFCQTSNIEAQRVREVAAEFGDSVALNEYSADDRPLLLRHQIARGIFINGREICWGHEAPRGGIRDAITQALRT